MPGTDSRRCGVYTPARGEKHADEINEANQNIKEALRAATRSRRELRARYRRDLP